MGMYHVPGTSDRCFFNPTWRGQIRAIQHYTSARNIRYAAQSLYNLLWLIAHGRGRLSW